MNCTKPHIQLSFIEWESIGPMQASWRGEEINSRNTIMQFKDGYLIEYYEVFNLHIPLQDRWLDFPREVCWLSVTWLTQEA
jgi:hypothetical protein